MAEHVEVRRTNQSVVRLNLEGGVPFAELEAFVTAAKQAGAGETDRVHLDQLYLFGTYRPSIYVVVTHG